MSYVLAIPSTTPVLATRAALQAAYPSSIFPASFAGLEDFHVYSVTPSLEPEYDPTTHKLILQPFTGSGSSWTQAWTIEPLPAAELAALNPPQWQEFAAAVVMDPAINSMLTAVAAAGFPALAGGLQVGMGQAAEGKPQTFVTMWAGVTPMLTEGLAAHLAAMATTYHLPAAFVANLNPA